MLSISCNKLSTGRKISIKNFFEGNTSSDSRKYEKIVKCFDLPRIEMTQHYNSIECCHYRYDLIKQKFVASLGLVLPVPCLKWVGLNFFHRP